jgi:hypothetical protein
MTSSQSKSADTPSLSSPEASRPAAASAAPPLTTDVSPTESEQLPALQFVDDNTVQLAQNDANPSPNTLDQSDTAQRSA